MGGVNSKKGCSGEKQKFFWESEDFARDQEAWKIFQHEVMKLKFWRV